MKRTMPTIPEPFSWMLLDFNNTVVNNPPVEKVKDKLLELKEDAKISPNLNYRQREAIITRVDNYINGTYGNTKTAENLAYANK